MTITADEIGKLIKFLEMTFSDQDGEALTALRMANKILAKHKINYRELLMMAHAKKEEPPVKPPPQPQNHTNTVSPAQQASYNEYMRHPMTEDLWRQQREYADHMAGQQQKYAPFREQAEGMQNIYTVNVSDEVKRSWFKKKPG